MTDQYRNTLIALLSQNIGIAEKFSQLLAYLKGNESAAYWAALTQLAQDSNIPVENQAAMITQMVQAPSESWAAFNQPAPQPEPQPTADQWTADRVEALLAAPMVYENKVQTLYNAMNTGDQAQVWAAIESVAQKYGVATGKTIRDTVNALAPKLTPAGLSPEYYPAGYTPAVQDYGPPSWIEPFSNMLSTPYNQNSEDYFRWMQGMQSLLQQYPDALPVLSDVMRQQGINNGQPITTPEAIANGLWNSDYMTRLNVIANFGGNPQPVQPTAVASETWTAPTTTTTPTEPAAPTDTATLTATNEPDWVLPFSHIMASSYSKPAESFRSSLGSLFTKYPDALPQVINALAEWGFTGITTANDAINALLYLPYNRKLGTVQMLGGTPVSQDPDPNLVPETPAGWSPKPTDPTPPPTEPTEQPTQPPQANPNTNWTQPRGQTPVPNQPWARTPNYWSGGDWIPTGEYSPSVEYQETINALLPWLSPMDQNTYAQYLSGAQPEIYGSQGGKGYGDLSSTKIERLNPYQAYQYDTSNRIQSARETIMDPWTESDTPLLYPDSPVMNWVDAVLREAGRYSPGGLNVNAPRRTREQQSIYDQTLTNLLSEQGAASYGVDNSYTNASGETVPLYDMWSNWLSSFLAPTQMQQPVSSRAYTPAWRQSQYVQNQPGSNRGWGYTNVRWS